MTRSSMPSVCPDEPGGTFRLMVDSPFHIQSVVSVGEICPGPDDERCFSSYLLRDREERRAFPMFPEQQVFSLGQDAHNLNRHAR
jgi:hypothetical protein